MTAPGSSPVNGAIGTVESVWGTWVEDVQVAIAYDIIQHFSSQLYASPYKALEELVTNGFDAGASEVRTYIPSGMAKEHVVVWDDGHSMGKEELHELWWIARSPKRSTTRVIESNAGVQRKVIGKFGIGKLASYAVGSTVFHLCKQQGHILLVGLDYGTITPSEPPTSNHPIGIYELNEDDARSWLLERLDAEAEAFSIMWNRPSWTAAVISGLHPSVDLKSGRLRWLLGNGMPLRPDFTVYAEDIRVAPKALKNSVRTFTFSDTDVVDALRKIWTEAVAKGEVSGKVTFATNAAGQATVCLPTLGEVIGEGQVFGRSLVKDSALEIDPEGEIDEGRMHGFFIMVRDRLINPTDPRFFLPEPSYGTFNRMQIRIYADGLDDELLADREHVRGDLPGARELTLVQRALYSVARLAVEAHEARLPKWEEVGRLLPVEISDLFREPLSSYLARNGEPNEDYANAFSGKVVRKDVGDDGPLSSVDATEGFVLNTTHPFYASFGSSVGSAKDKRDRLARTMEAFAIAERLTEGWLYDRGMDWVSVQAVMNLRDAFFKQIASRLTYQNADDILAEAENTSHLGQAEFEVALTRVFQRMGFVAERHGASGEEDILVVAPIGRGHSSFIVEAKGSKHAIGTKEAKVSAALSHCRTVEADFAVIIAREFQARESGVEGGVYKECEATDGKVVMLELAALFELYRATGRFAYGLDQVIEVLNILQPPVEKLATTLSLKTPIDGFGYRRVLDYMWELQQNQSKNDEVPLKWVYQALLSEHLGFTTETDFFLRLQALATLTPLFVLSGQNGRIKQEPEQVVVSIEAALQVTADVKADGSS